MLPADETNELVGKDEVDVGGQDEFSAGAPDARILRDHLKKRQAVGVFEAVMQHGGHHDDPGLTVGGFRRQLEHARQAGTAGDRVPVHQDQFGRQPVFFALAGEGIDENLRANQRIPPVIIIA